MACKDMIRKEFRVRIIREYRSPFGVVLFGEPKIVVYFDTQEDYHYSDHYSFDKELKKGDNIHSCATPNSVLYPRFKAQNKKSKDY